MTSDVGSGGQKRGADVWAFPYSSGRMVWEDELHPAVQLIYRGPGGCFLAANPGRRKMKTDEEKELRFLLQTRWGPSAGMLVELYESFKKMLLFSRCFISTNSFRRGYEGMRAGWSTGSRFQMQPKSYWV